MANFDDLHVELARKIQDPVATSATAGQEVSVALRTDYLNKANKFISLAVWESGGKNFISKFLSGLKATHSLTFLTAGVSLNADYHYFLEAQADTGPTILTFHPSKMELDALANPNLANAFTIDGGKIYGYDSSGLLNTPDTGKLFYVKTDVGAVSGTINIDPIWFDSMIEIAASFHFEDKGELEMAQAIVGRWKIISTILANR